VKNRRSAVDTIYKSNRKTQLRLNLLDDYKKRQGILEVADKEILSGEKSRKVRGARELFYAKLAETEGGTEGTDNLYEKEGGGYEALTATGVFGEGGAKEGRTVNVWTGGGKWEADDYFKDYGKEMKAKFGDELATLGETSNEHKMFQFMARTGKEGVEF
jgi:hypothetical protein